MERIIEIRSLRKSFDGGRIKALNGVDLDVDHGEFVSIMGPSGSGKSTLLNMIGALDVPDSGTVKVAGRDLKDERDLSRLRAEEIGFVFQLHNLIPNLTALENVEIPMFAVKWDDMEGRAMELLDYVGLADKADRKPTELSGGERQRVAIARALANDPSIILADEPTGSLDSRTGKRILEGLRELQEDEGVTLIVVTHDPDVASMASRIVRILDGVIISDDA
ncbi:MULTISPECIES: ABC transporter ATP-binding protein [Methanothermobacter]|uniref:ABC transporter ATP-binding protein n=1 Tax=Methanothermobacter wolfeii TaxID=145261 RepID=A0A9E7UL23_METWO|nr:MULTISPECIES: ABC transporter ATP-binding protein [Methanothermobacter]NLM03164.1 ABC transporter ATP-binding protein [Methanothermobacter wolfeii]QHN07497.1 ABC transporter ATP-binding protein [Methanothermobacter sp. THM-2]UXH30995.1 ABC transporter ATP-binding protein [Methanothermobacter wolfeii]